MKTFDNKIVGFESEGDKFLRLYFVFFYGLCLKQILKFFKKYGNERLYRVRFNFLIERMILDL